jgi:hypothetical protein
MWSGSLQNMRVLDISVRHGSDSHAYETLRRNSVHVWKELHKIVSSFLFEKPCRDDSRSMIRQHIQSPYYTQHSYIMYYMRILAQDIVSYWNMLRVRDSDMTSGNDRPQYEHHSILWALSFYRLFQFLTINNRGLQT